MKAIRPESPSHVLGLAGATLIILGIILTIWIILLIRMALFEPQDIPLLDNLMNSPSEFEVSQRDSRLEFSGTPSLMAVAVAIFLIFALGGIVKGLISNGVKLLGFAFGFGGDKKKE